MINPPLYVTTVSIVGFLLIVGLYFYFDKNIKEEYARMSAQNLEKARAIYDKEWTKPLCFVEVVTATKTYKSDVFGPCWGDDPLPWHPVKNYHIRVSRRRAESFIDQSRAIGYFKFDNTIIPWNSALQINIKEQ